MSRCATSWRGYVVERSFPTRLGDMLPEELKMYFDYVWDWTGREASRAPMGASPHTEPRAGFWFQI